MGNETGETPTPPPFPLGHGARHIKRAKIPWPSCARTGTPASQPFRDSEKSAHLLKICSKIGAREMSRLSFGLLIATGLMLTAYFGAAAWRMSDENHMDVTGHITPRAK